MNKLIELFKKLFKCKKVENSFDEPEDQVGQPVILSDEDTFIPSKESKSIEKVTLVTKKPKKRGRPRKKKEIKIEE